MFESIIVKQIIESSARTLCFHICWSQLGGILIFVFSRLFPHLPGEVLLDCITPSWWWSSRRLYIYNIQHIMPRGSLEVNWLASKSSSLSDAGLAAAASHHPLRHEQHHPGRPGEFHLLGPGVDRGRSDDKDRTANGSHKPDRTSGRQNAKGCEAFRWGLSDL